MSSGDSPRAAWPVACVLTIAGCGGGSTDSMSPTPSAMGGTSNASPAASMPLPGNTSGPYTLQGDVFAVETGPISHAAVNLWIQEPKFGYSY
jgi:hypothetical protein